MTQTPEPAAKKRASGLNSMLIADLKAMAGALGIAGSGGMKKAQLVEAIKSVQSGHARSKAAQSKSAQSKSAQSESAQSESAQSESAQSESAQSESAQSESAQSDGGAGSGAENPASPERPARATRAAKKAAALEQSADSPETEPNDDGSQRRDGSRDSDARQGAQSDQHTQSDQAGQTSPAGRSEQPNEQPQTDGNPDRRENAKKARPSKESRSSGKQQADEREQSNGEQSNGEQSNGKQSNDQQSSQKQGSDTQRSEKQSNDRQRVDDQQQSNRGGQDGAQSGGQEGGQGQQPDDEAGGRRNRRRRSRDRNAPRPGGQGDQGDQSNQGNPGGRGNQGHQGNTDRNSGGSTRNEPDSQILEDDVLVPAAGILDVLDNYAFVRTSGYLPGSEDVYLSLSMVRKFGMRRGDAVVGQVRQPREGERKEKFNPMVRIDSINGAEPETARHRLEFDKLTPVYPSERLRLETTADNLIGRVVDIAAPIGKGQRGLIVSPAKAGKTMILQSIVSSITANNPECHLMVVLVDERPEEVTDFERSVKGEVIASTFDRPPSDHTLVAELAIERAKRLVELGLDVVVLLDGITRLGRAYNLSTPASGRVLSGALDSAALYPPKKFFGAARNIENGGSLTIVATAVVESGSKMDEVIFEEFQGTANMELRLRRDLADKRIFPAIDAVASGTRREELLLSPEEVAIVWKLRRVLSGLDGQEALELLLGRLSKSQSNVEFLTQVQKSAPTPER